MIDGLENWHEPPENEAKRKECFDFVTCVNGNVLLLDAIGKELHGTVKLSNRIARNELTMAIDHLNLAVLMLNDAVSREVAHLIEEVGDA